MVTAPLSSLKLLCDAVEECRALNVTIVTSAARAAARLREDQRRCKNAAELGRHPDLEFRLVAFDSLDGVFPHGPK